MIEHRNEKAADSNECLHHYSLRAGGELHRTDGPAVVRADGTREWYLNGKRHRTDGPAVVYANGYQEWWVDGEFIKYAQSGERKQKRGMTNYKEAAAKYKELREATTELLKAIDGLFPTDGPVKARVRAALKEDE
jgi:hypothetical protein